MITTGGYLPETLIKEWNQLEDEDRTLIIKAGRNAVAANLVKQAEDISADAITLADQEKANAEKTVRQTTKDTNEVINKEFAEADKVITDANATEQNTDTRDAQERAIEQQSMHMTLKRQTERIAKENERKKQIEIEKAEAWHNDVDLSNKLEEEFDTPQEQRDYEEGYEGHVTDNQGLHGHEGFEEHDPGKFSESIFGQIWDGVLDIGEAIYDIYDYKGPDSIEVNPLQEEYSTTDRDASGRFEVIEDRPSVNTNPNLETKPSTFQEQMKKSESSGDYEVVNDEGFMGAYQFGDARLRDFKSANQTNFTKDEFLNNPELQDKVFDWHVKDYKKRIKKAGLDSYIGKTINGVEVTEDGLVAVAHLGGFVGMRQFLKSNGKDDEADSNGTSMTDYLKKFKA